VSSVLFNFRLTLQPVTWRYAYRIPSTQCNCSRRAIHEQLVASNTASECSSVVCHTRIRNMPLTQTQLTDKMTYTTAWHSDSELVRVPDALTTPYAEPPQLTGRDSVGGTASRWWLDALGIESRWEARFSAPVQTGPGVHPASCTMGTGSRSRE
jgi:hypothetical protein